MSFEDEELQSRELGFKSRQHSYELTQQLTYFVVSIALVVCGYMLLNAEKLSVIREARFLFLVCGLSAFFGLLWRFFYNQIYHGSTHGQNGWTYRIIARLVAPCYAAYVIFLLIAFIWMLVAGFVLLTNI